jgi:hypothetical protein
MLLPGNGKLGRLGVKQGIEGREQHISTPRAGSSSHRKDFHWSPRALESQGQPGFGFLVISVI